MSVHSISVRTGGATKTAQQLRKALAETKLETAKAQTFHWNVKGMAFGPLHSLFQEIYEEHFEAEDELAERMRALDIIADGRFRESLAASSLKESKPDLKAEEMVSALVNDQWQLSETMQDLAKAAETESDQVTADIATERSKIHDKFAWMLRSHLSD